MMTERLNKIKDTLDIVRSLEKVPGSNPKELISAQSQVTIVITITTTIISTINYYH